MAKKKIEEQKNIEQYEHTGEERLNNPPVGLVTAHSDNGGLRKKTYEYDTHLDPQLQWAGKTEHTSFEVNTVSLHVHERIDTKKIIESVRKEDTAPKQPSLFESFQKPLRQAVEFYRHREGWTNRLVAGDSLLVMNSLIEKEAMAGKVQMIYFDPPYGIKYGSNFQPFTNKRDVKDGKDEDLTAEPEMIKAFRDTWELGIHSYLTYLRDRLLLAREMLSESGSVFVQISDENVHLIRCILDEVFGKTNEVATIVWKKGTPISKTIRNSFNYILWYCKDIEKVKSKKVFLERTGIEGSMEDPKKLALWGDFNNGETRTLSTEEKRNIQATKQSASIFRVDKIIERGDYEDRKFEFEFEGKKYKPDNGYCWRGNPVQMERLKKANRIIKTKEGFGFKFYITDYPIVELTNFWDDTAGNISDMVYVVQTNEKIIQRCLFMTTDPGDLVLDITCGSGTTAFVAEQWGRRWITCDTSRVAITLAKQRLMTAMFDYYELAQPENGVGSGFKYKTVPHITLKSIANNEPAPVETLYDQPLKDNKRLRVTGPFTVEAVPSPVAKSLEEEVFSSEFSVFSEEKTKNEQLKTKNLKQETQNYENSVTRTGETLRQNEWLDKLRKVGVRGKSGNRIEFVRLESLSGTRYLQAEGETNDEKPKKVLVVFGPEHAPLEKRTVEEAIKEARWFNPNLLLLCAFQIDEGVDQTIDEMPSMFGFDILKIQMNIDLQTEDLKKKTRDDAFFLIGQPDVRVFSCEFLVFSENNIKLADYATFKKLSGLNSLAEINELSNEDILYYSILSQGRDVWTYLADAKGWRFDTEQHSRGTTKKLEGGVPAVSWNSTRLIGGIGNTDNDFREFGIHSETEIRRTIERLRRDSTVVSSLKEIAGQLDLRYTKNQPLKTKNYTEVEVNGFDYYNPKAGNVISGGKNEIAMWMLDTDYDGQSIFPSQIFFPMSGAKEGWSKLAKNLKAEIDEEKIEAFNGTVSLPFWAGRAVAVKIIDARGIESLKIIRI